MTVATTFKTSIAIVFLCSLFAVGVQEARAQNTDNVGIGTPVPDNSALLELNSQSKGLLVPRMTQAERDAILQPSSGLLIFNTSTASFQYNFGSKGAPSWVTVLWFQGNDNGSANQLFWSLGGNDSVNTNNFLGTINDASLVFKSKNITRLVLTAAGEINVTGATNIFGSLNLANANTPLLLDGQPGARGGVFISSGPALTPRWSSDMVVSDTGLVLDANTYVNKPLVIRDSARFLVLPKIPLLAGHILSGDLNDIASPVAPGVNGALLQIVAGFPQWVDPDRTLYWTLNGNTGTDVSSFVGTRDASDLRLGTNNTFRVTIAASNGEVTINSLAGAGLTNPPESGEGLVMVDGAGRLFKRESQSLLQLPQNNMYIGDANNVAQPFPPGADSTFLATMSGIPTWVDAKNLLRDRPWIIGGNFAVGINPILGNLSTSGVLDLDIYAGGQSMLFLNGSTQQIDARVPFNLVGSSTPLLLNGLAGSAGMVLTSNGAGNTPVYTDSLSLRELTVSNKLTISGRSEFADTATFLVRPKIPLPYGNMLTGDANDWAAPMAPGVNGSLLQIIAGQPLWVDPDRTEYWTLSGNTAVASSSFVGTRDANDLRLGTNSAFRVTISGVTGDVTVNSLAGATVAGPIAVNEGFVSADGAGRLVKRDISTILRLPEDNFFIGDSNDLASPFPPGSDSTFLGIFNGKPTWYNLGSVLSTRSWLIGGNVNPPSNILGNLSPTGNTDLDVRAGGTTRLFLQGSSEAVDVRSSLNLDGSNREMRLNGNPGTDGFVFVSFGPGKTPYYTDSLTLRKLRITDSLIIDAKFDLPLTYAHMFVGDVRNKAIELVPGINGSLLQIVAGAPQWVDPDKTDYWTISGNTAVPASAYVGTRDGNDLRFGTNNAFRVTISGTSGEVTINNLAGPGLVAPPTLGEGFVIADNAGKLVKRDVISFLQLPENYLYVGDSNDVARPFAPGADSTVLGVLGGSPSWINISALLRDRAWIQGGNNNVTSPIIGNMQTAGITDLDLRAGGQSKLFLQGGADVIDVRSSLNLDGLGREIRLNGNPGVDGFVMVSWGPGRTPYYTDSLVLRKLRVTDSLKLPLSNGHIFVGDASNVATQVPPGVEGALLQITAGYPTWVDPSLSGFWSLQGNQNIPPTAFLGTRDASDLRLNTNNALRLTISSAGQVTVNDLAGATVPGALAAQEGFVSADATGKLTKRDLSSILALPLNNLFVGDVTNKAAPFAPGADSTVLGILAGAPSWIDVSGLLRDKAWIQGGNTLVSSPVLGNMQTAGITDLDIRAGGQTRLFLQGSAEVVDVRSSLNLDGTNRELRLNGSPGADGFILVSLGPGKTPYYTDSLVLRKLRVSDSLKLPLNFGNIYVGDATNTAAMYPPGADSTLLSIVGGTPTWTDYRGLLAGFAWVQGGNATITNNILGNMRTTGDRDLDIRAGGNSMIFLDAAASRINARDEFNLDGTDVPLLLNGSAGSDGFVLVSKGPGLTPYYSDSLVLRKLRVTDSLKLPLNYANIYVGDITNNAAQLPPGTNGSLLQIDAGQPRWVPSEDAAYWALTGNTGIAASAFVGTRDANDLRFATDNTTRVTIAQGTGNVTMTSLAGAPSSAPVGANDGIVVTDASGLLQKKDRSIILGLLGIYGGRYTNTSAAPEFNVVVTLPPGATMDPQAAIVVTPEASTSVSVTPFIVNGSRTANSFAINFPGGLNPGEAINWLVRNP